VIVSGMTFLMAGEQHLWVVLSDPTQSAASVVVANFTTYRGDGDRKNAIYDPSCLIYPGEHRFVTDVTCVRYQDAHLTTADHLEIGIQTNTLLLHDPVSPALLKKIQSGLGDSIHTPDECFEILVSQGLC
jgi:hypothetical protein